MNRNLRQKEPEITEIIEFYLFYHAKDLLGCRFLFFF